MAGGAATGPVIDFSWDDTKEFLAWLSQKTGHAYRLPTEAEWEYAARGGAAPPFPGARRSASATPNAPIAAATPARGTVPVGSFRPNAFGVYDTAGNAAEWVQDCWNASYRGAPHDGSAWLSGDCSLRVLRGGSFANKANARALGCAVPLR